MLLVTCKKQSGSFVLNRVDFRLSIGAEGHHRVFGQHGYQGQCRITHLPHSFHIIIMELSLISRRGKGRVWKVQLQVLLALTN